MKKTSINFLSLAGSILLATFYSHTVMAQCVSHDNVESFKSVTIGQKVWMAENLNVCTFRNGDSITQAQTPEEWIIAGEKGQPAWCYYNNSDSLGAVYGKLYNWFAVNDVRGLAPEGWHIPTNADWTATTKSLGGVDIAGIKLKNTKMWTRKSLANNKSGFSALPGGIRYGNGKFSGLNQVGQWWSNSNVLRFPEMSHTLKLQESYVEVFYETKEKSCGLSVRVLKD